MLKSKLKYYKKAIFIIAIFFPFFAWNQSNKIELIHSDFLRNSKKHPNTSKVEGNVHFRKDDLNMYCDSALYNQTHNWIRAYGKVHINQGDTLNLYCDSLYFFGNNNQGTLYSNVRMRDNEYRLNSDSIHYDANRSIASYENWAYISSIHKKLTLTSIRGYYYANSKTFFFKDSVVLKDEGYTLTSDTLQFKTDTEEAFFHGPTKIEIDSTIIYCVKGIYDTKNGEVNLWNKATILKGSQTIIADSLYYHQDLDIAKGYRNVQVIDTTEKVELRSHYLYKSKDNLEMILIDEAKIINYAGKDTFLLLADTIFQYLDTLTDQKTNIAISNVEIFNGNIIAKCDSIYHSEKDSLIKLRKKPIIWNENMQLTSDSMNLLTFDNEFKVINLYEKCFAITEHDSIHYDQINGSFMTAFLDSNIVQKIYVNGNAQTLYYPSEETTDSLLVKTKVLKGKNLLISEEIVVLFKNGEVDFIKFIDMPDASFYPLNKIQEKDLYLKGFIWLINEKPERKFVN